MSQTVNLIVSVFQQEGLCSGSFPYESVANQVAQELQRHGVRMLSWEPVAERACCAVLIFAEGRGEDSSGERGPTNVLQLRRDLTVHLSAQRLQVRVQREDVFLAMHRLSVLP
jgi:hypothetical protein